MASIVQPGKGFNLERVGQNMERFGGLAAQSLVNSANNQAQTVQSLSQRLSQVSSKMTALGDEQMIFNAKVKARSDINKNQVEVFEGQSMYAMAYSDAASLEFAAKVETDAKGVATRYAAQNQFNPEKFVTDFGSYSNKVVQKIQDPALRSIAERAFTRYGSAAQSGLVAAQGKRIRDNQIKSYQGLRDSKVNDYKAAIASGRHDLAIEIEAELNDLHDSAVFNTFVSEGEVVLFKRSMKASAYKDATLAQFNKVDDKFKAYKEFKANVHPDLTLEEKNDIEAKMVAAINTEVSLYDQEEKKQADKIEKVYRDTEKAFNYAWITGSLLQSDLDKAYEEDKITTTSYDKLSKRLADPGVQYDNTAQLLKIETNILTISDEEIMEADLTNATKATLINKKKERITSEEDKWSNSEAGKEAFGRINRRFNIMKGSFSFGATIPKGYDAVRRDFYDTVSSLPIEQRTGQRLVEIADEAIARYDGDRDKAKTENAERRKKEAEAKAAKEAEDEKNLWYNKFIESMKNYAEEAMQTDPGEY